MGKKSKAAKAKAKAGAGDGSSGPKEGGGTGGGTSGDAMVTSNKRQNCVRCFGTVKADKGSACPGCSLLYCWRCEKKYFVPSRITFFGRHVESDLLRYAVGTVIVAVVFGFLLVEMPMQTVFRRSLMTYGV